MGRVGWSARLTVARNTVGVAYERLAAEGYLDSRVGSGTFVRVTHAPRRGASGASVLRPRPVWDALTPWPEPALAGPEPCDFAGRLDLVPSSAGLHVTAFAAGDLVDEDRLALAVARAGGAGVALHTLAQVAMSGSVRPGLVFGYGAIDAPRIREGLARLSSAISPARNAPG